MKENMFKWMNLEAGSWKESVREGCVYPEGLRLLNSTVINEWQ